VADLVDRLNAKVAETRTIGGVPWRPWDDPYMRFDTGGPVHPSRQGFQGVDGALRLQPVYSSVRILAEGVAMLPLQQFRDLGDRRQKMPLGQLLSKPSAFLSTFDWLFQYVSSAALQGCAPGLITGRDGYGMPTSVEWLPPEDFFAEDTKPFNPARTRFYYAGRQIQRDDLLLVNAFTIPGRSLGISPLRYFQMLIESGHHALAYGDGWYESGGFPPGTFQNSQYEVDDTQSEKIKRKLVQAQRRREPLVYGRDWEY
jgi:HK97 family phage portal protein